MQIHFRILFESKIYKERVKRKLEERTKKKKIKIGKVKDQGHKEEVKANIEKRMNE